MEIHCKNCKEKLKGSICHNCGLKYDDQRWTLDVIIRQFLAQLSNIESGFLYTSKMLFTSPQKIIKDYWLKITIKYYNPFRYLLIWVTISVILGFLFGIDDIMQENMQPENLAEDFGKSRVESADQRFDNWLSFLVLLLVPPISFITFLLFKKQEKNFAEHLVMNSFVFGQHAILGSITQFIYFLFPFSILFFFIINFLTGVVYNSYVYKSLFEESLPLSILKAIVVGIAGLIVYFLLVALFSTLALVIS